MSLTEDVTAAMERQKALTQALQEDVEQAEKEREQARAIAHPEEGVTA